MTIFHIPENKENALLEMWAMQLRALFCPRFYLLKLKS